MSVKHVCPNCGSTLTLDAPMPSLRCPKCKTAMQPETVSDAADAVPNGAAAVRPMRVARTVSAIGPQPVAAPAETERLLEEARFKAQQERDRLLVEANKQIQQAKADAEASLQQLREQKLAEVTAEASAIVETANQNAAEIQTAAENAAQQRLAEAEEAVKSRLEEAEAAAKKRIEEAEAAAKERLEAAETAAAPQTDKQPDAAPAADTPVAAAPQAASLEEQKAKIDQLARQNQIRFWRLNAYVAILILTFICAVKSNGNTLVAVLSSLAAIISIGLAAYAVYTLRHCIALLKAEKSGQGSPAPSPSPAKTIQRKPSSIKIKKEKETTVTGNTHAPDADASQTVAPPAQETPQSTSSENALSAEATAPQDISAEPSDETPQTGGAPSDDNASTPEGQPSTKRRTLLPVSKKKTSKPLLIKKKSAE